MATLQDPTARILGPDGRPWHSDAPDGIKLPQVWTFGSLINQYSKSYSWRWDEAYKNSRETALAMRRDCFLMGLLRERQLPTEQMRWHLEPEDKKDQQQLDECEYLEKVIRRTPYFHNLKRALLEGIWYGRAGVQVALTREEVDGQPAVIISNHLPVNGDKIQFSWDGTPEIRLYMAVMEQVKQAGGNVVIGDVGAMLRLDTPFWRSRFIIHKHDVIDADFMSPESAGQVGGIGIRDHIYWLNWMKLEVMSWLMDFMERTGLGLTIYYYDAASATGEQQARARAQQDGRNTVIVYPRNADGSDVGNGIERIETQTAGAEVIIEMVGKMFDDKIERYIIGQTLSSKTEGSGLGGTGVASMHGNTKFRIIKSDCDNLAETMTEQLVVPLKKLNPFTQASPYRYKWVFNVDEFDPEAKLKAAQIAYSMGVSFSEDELREPTGFSKPAEDEEPLRQFDATEYHLLNAQARAAGKNIPFPSSNGAKGPPGGEKGNLEQKERFLWPDMDDGERADWLQMYEEGRWVTIHGTHVFIKNGKITKGPKHLVNLKPDQAEPILKLGPQKWWEKNHKEDEPHKAAAKEAKGKTEKTPAITPGSPATNKQAHKETLAGIAKEHIKEKTVGIAFDKLYEKAQETHPEMTKEDFRELMTEFHNEGDQFRLGGWSGVFDHLPDPELLTHIGGEKNRGPRDQADRNKPADTDVIGKSMYYLQPSPRSQGF